MSNSYQTQKDETGEWTVVTPVIKSTGAAIAPTTTTYNELRYKIIGKTMHFAYRYGHTGAGTAGEFQLYLPSGLKTKAEDVQMCGSVYIASSTGTSMGYVQADTDRRFLNFYLSTGTLAGLTSTAGALNDAACNYKAQGTVELE